MIVALAYTALFLGELMLAALVGVAIAFVIAFLDSLV